MAKPAERNNLQIHVRLGLPESLCMDKMSYPLDSLEISFTQNCGRHAYLCLYLLRTLPRQIVVCAQTQGAAFFPSCITF